MINNYIALFLTMQYNSGILQTQLLSMSNQVNIQINHTVQTNVQKIVHNQTSIDHSLIKLITIKEFQEIFYSSPYFASQSSNIENLKNADLFWDSFFGHISRAVHHGKNKKALYLTEESAHMILKHIEKFVSGFDFYNKPRGFLMVKNPNSGILDVLHYSNYLHELQKESPINYLAINVDPKTDNIDDNINNPFEGEQKKWYEALQSKCILNNGLKTCTKQELQSAFIHFSTTLQNMGLEFYPPNFAKAFKNNPVNHVVLLARWETLLRNCYIKNHNH